MKLVEKFILLCKKRGVLHALSIVLLFIKSKLEIVHPIYRRRIKLSKQIDKLLNSTIAYGPFRGLKFSKDSWWGGADRASMLLGLYEQEVLESLSNIPNTHKIFIDLGAADGYYGIGVLINKLFECSYCFEISKAGREVLCKNAELNGVADKLVINGIARKDFFKQLPRDHLSKSVLFVDIEGGEFDLFDKELFGVFKGSIIFIELHDWFFEDGERRLEKIRDDASQYFDITELTTASRDLSRFIELRQFSDTDRWLICSEGRAELMTWYRLDPKIS